LKLPYRSCNFLIPQSLPAGTLSETEMLYLPILNRFCQSSLLDSTIGHQNLWWHIIIRLCELAVEMMCNCWYNLFFSSQILMPSHTREKKGPCTSLLFGFLRRQWTKFVENFAYLGGWASFSWHLEIRLVDTYTNMTSNGH
jgi:hypothetical protein